MLDIVILVALPASGKSEVRKYLASLSPERCRDELALGETVQLDDFPYVHLMRRIDDELRETGHPTVFFHSADKPFKDPIEWGTLIELLNEDHARLVARAPFRTPSAGYLILDRIDAARAAVGGGRPLGGIPAAVRAAVAAGIEAEARDLLNKLEEAQPPTLEGKTVVIEFARGGPHGASMPLPAPYGYAYSLSRLSPRILERAAVLYVWVTPEESRRKNIARGDPNDPGSILHHSVPLDVMMNDYGCDDIDWLLSRSERPDTVRIEAHGRTFDLPLARFDNRVDKTSFVRNPRERWQDEEVGALHEGLSGALRTLAGLRGAAAPR